MRVAGVHIYIPPRGAPTVFHIATLKQGIEALTLPPKTFAALAAVGIMRSATRNVASEDRIQILYQLRDAIIATMVWIREHPYASTFALAGIVLAAITILVGGSRIDYLVQRPATPSSDGSIFPAAQTAPTTDNTPAFIETSVPRYSASGSYSSAPAPEGSAAQSTDSSDSPDSALSALLSSFYQPQQTQAPDTSVGDALLREIYALIPSGVTVFGGTRTPTHTPQQQALFAYGNDAGQAILAFLNAHTDMTDDLKNWFDNRTSAAYKAPVLQIANDMAEAGAALATLSNVPPSAASANQRLAKSLQDAAAKLKAITAAGSDGNIAEAMKTYNASADEFTKSYIALADLFTLHQVTFSQSDTGSAFTFPAQ